MLRKLWSFFVLQVWSFVGLHPMANGSSLGGEGWAEAPAKKLLVRSDDGDNRVGSVRLPNHDVATFHRNPELVHRAGYVRLADL
jgi:hypothetical protein